MKLTRQKDFWAALIFIGTGMGFALGSTQYGFGSSARPGPGYFPFGLGLLLAATGLVVLFRAATAAAPVDEPVGPFAWRPLVCILGSAALFGLLLPRAGLVITLPLLIAVASMAGGRPRWKHALISAAVLTAGAWLVFSWGLGLALPIWPRGLG
jgi:hypothetical protein